MSGIHCSLPCLRRIASTCSSSTNARSLGELFYLVEHENGHGVKIRAGRFIFTPIEGNVFDKRVEGFDLRPARSGTHLFMGRTYDGARQKVLGMSLTAYF